MKKFLSTILSLSLIFCASTSAFADEVNGTDNQEEQHYLEIAGILPFTWGNVSKFYNGTSNIIKKAINGIEQFGQMGYRLNGINYGLSALAAFGLIGKNLYERIKLNLSQISQDVDVVIKELDKELKCIKGQEKAKKKMRETVAAIIDARNEAKENNKPYGKGDVIYMIGPSGVGKTFSAECLSRAIMGPEAEPIRIDSSCFDKASSVGLKSQILYMKDQQKNNGSMNYYYIDNSLAAKIASNPNKVLLFDEYDKWGTPETDEFLRTIVDKGIIYRDGERINCSNLLVIVISNEDRSSVTAGNGMGVFQDDGTGSRTHMEHDKSFLNRLRFIEFDNLYRDAYEEITKEQLGKIALRCKKLYSVDFEFGNVARKIAIKVERLNQGAREIEKILGALREKIITERQNFLESFKGRVFIVDYDPCNDEFTLRDKNDEIDNEAEDLATNSEILKELPGEQLVRSEILDEYEEKNLKEENTDVTFCEDKQEKESLLDDYCDICEAKG